MFRTATFRTALARSLAIALAATLAEPLVCAQRAWAQDPPPVRIRDTIERVDGATSVSQGARRRRTQSNGRRQCANCRHQQSIALRHQTKLVCRSDSDAAA